MKKFGFATIAATGFAAALVGLAAPAVAAPTVAAPTGLSSVEFAAGIDHQQWINDIQPQVRAPRPAVVGNGR